MKNTSSYKWAYLPVLFCSAAVLSTQLVAGEYQAQEAKQVSSIGHQYVGGGTRVGVSITDDGDASADLSHIFSETQNSSTSGGLWAGFDLDGDDKGVDSGGVQINHNWVSRDGQGNASHVNKAFAAYDRNEDDDAKVTIGYGQERAGGTWEGHVSKGLTDKRLVTPATSTTKAVYEKAYDWGVGGSVGTFIPGSNTRVRAGVDHQWGDETASNEERAAMTTLSAGVEQFFQGTPHSIGLDVAASRKTGGYEYDGSDDTETSANLSYHYDFGGANIYQPDQRYRRVRVEVPGKGRAATYAKKPVYKKQPIYKNQPVYKNQPIYKKQPIYVNKSVQVPAGNMAKSTVELEGQTFFKYGSAVLIPSAQQRLRQIASEIRKHGYQGNIRITGNSCGLGDPRQDQQLSEQRAHAVRNFMVAQGFNPAHLMARGLGKSHPKYPTTADQDFKNRRVDIEYVTQRQIAGGAGTRTENRRVQNGFRNVITGYKRVQTGTKNVQVGVRNVQTGTTDILVSQGAPGTPRVIWRTEAIPTAPTWIARALRSNFSHNRNVDTYLTTASDGDSGNTGGNTGPVAVDDTTKIYENQTASIDVLNNDYDSDGDSLTITDVTQGAEGGSVSIVNGQVVYTPVAGFTGKDTFTYTITDGNGTSSTASVSVSVSATDTGSTNNAPNAVDDYDITTDMGTAVTINVTANDTDPDEGDMVMIKSFGQASNGTVTAGGLGQLIYTPNAGFSDSDSFTYIVEDLAGLTSQATVYITVNGSAAVNLDPVAGDDNAETLSGKSVHVSVLANDSDPENGTISIDSFTQGSNGTVSQSATNELTYTANADFVGPDQFTYTIIDGQGGSSTATVFVDVKSANEDETDTGGGTGNGCTVVCTKVKSDDHMMFANTTSTIDVLDNDDGVDLNIITVSQGANGRVSISGNKVTYTPSKDFVGSDVFWYEVEDGTGYKDSNMVMVYVEAAK